MKEKEEIENLIRKIVKEAIILIENLGLRKIDLGAFNHTMHYFMIDLKQQKN